MRHETIEREVWIGGITKQELLQNLNSKGISLNEYALMIINHEDFTTLPNRQKVQTVEISISDLGFPKGAITSEVYQKANELGFRLCPAELGLHFRLQYIDPDQPIDPPKGCWQTIAMKKLTSDPNFPNGFYLSHREDGFWLRGYRASDDYLYNPDDRFIFIQEP